VTTANTDVAVSARRIDEVRVSLVAEIVMAEVVKRLQAFANTVVAPDQLAGPTRERIAVVSAEIESLRSITERWSTANAERSRVAALSKSVEAADAEKQPRHATRRLLVGSLALQQLGTNSNPHVTLKRLVSP
jgi:hypothetical protein